MTKLKGDLPYHKWGVSKRGKELFDTLPIEEKQLLKKHYEAIRLKNMSSRYPYPKMYDTTHLRISQLTQKHISRILTFKDHKI